jgi:ribonuclease R
MSETELRAIADECSQSERRAADAERELVEWKKVKFMIDRVGEEFDAMVISATKFGLFVELAELFIEGLVPIDSLPDDRYTYRENVRKIIGAHTRREFAIGDKVRVCLDRIDPAERKLQFSIVEPERKKKKRVKPRR